MSQICGEVAIQIVNTFDQLNHVIVIGVFEIDKCVLGILLIIDGNPMIKSLLVTQTMSVFIGESLDGFLDVRVLSLYCASFLFV